MDQRNVSVLLDLLRSSVCDVALTEAEKAQYSKERLPEMLAISKAHDVIHLMVLGLKQNGLISEDALDLEKQVFKAVFRHERLKYDYEQVCSALEQAKIAFLPLKGSVLRKYYPEPWMRTSCDIDILVRREGLERGIDCLVQTLQYEEKERTTHDVSLFSSSGTHVELHFDLVEEGRAKNAIDILSSVWDDVSLKETSDCWYEMSDAFFYFYHIAHMAKHFETGGCGIRPFLDLWILDRIPEADTEKRDALLAKGGLLQFATVARVLSNVWFGDATHTELSLQMQNFILNGGAYGSAKNRVALQQRKKGGRIGYLFSRIFIPYEKLKRYYPILEKHRWLMPFMQVRRWFMLLKPDVAKMAKRELATNRNIEKNKAEEMKTFLDDLGL